MNITQQDAEDIVYKCSKEMLEDFKYFYDIDNCLLIDRLMELNKITYTKEYIPQKDNINFVIKSDLEGKPGNLYRQFYFLIVEQGRTTPHYIEKLQRVKYV